MKNNQVLEIKNLTFGYIKDKLIYNNFNLSLQIGEIITIFGKSGSGKTTLFELISNELKPLKGEIKTLSIASIYQDPYSSFHPSYSIIEQIEDTIHKKIDINDSDLIEYLTRLNISQKLITKKPHQLSGGELQRCSILRALLIKPKLLLADEPTSALDNITQLEVMKLLISFLDKFAILLITHDRDLANWCSDKIIELN